MHHGLEVKRAVRHTRSVPKRRNTPPQTIACRAAQSLPDNLSCKHIIPSASLHGTERGFQHFCKDELAYPVLCMCAMLNNTFSFWSSGFPMVGTWYCSFNTSYIDSLQDTPIGLETNPPSGDCTSSFIGAPHLISRLRELLKYHSELHHRRMHAACGLEIVGHTG